MDHVDVLDISQLPPQLQEIPNPPEKLYLRGALPPQGTKFLTVVGSRHMSEYAKNVIDFFMAGLQGYPVTIVSGLALGCDGRAHRSAITHGLHTIALPGSGISDSVIYPHSHRPLAHEILRSGGALLSEYEPDEKTKIHFFPERNRVMVGLSDAVLVIEAGVKSGTLITARLATDYNRELLAAPHSVFSEGGAGGHLFMKLGAAPCRSASDILEALKIEEAPASMTQLSLTEDEETVLELLTEPLSRDEIIRELGLTAGEANVLLAQMEIRGLIAESLGDIRKLV